MHLKLREVQSFTRDGIFATSGDDSDGPHGLLLWNTRELTQPINRISLGGAFISSLAYDPSERLLVVCCAFGTGHEGLIAVQIPSLQIVHQVRAYFGLIFGLGKGTAYCNLVSRRGDGRTESHLVSVDLTRGTIKHYSPKFVRPCCVHPVSGELIGVEQTPPASIVAAESGAILADFHEAGSPDYISSSPQGALVCSGIPVLPGPIMVVAQGKKPRPIGVFGGHAIWHEKLGVIYCPDEATLAAFNPDTNHQTILYCLPEHRGSSHIWTTNWVSSACHPPRLSPDGTWLEWCWHWRGPGAQEKQGRVLIDLVEHEYTTFPRQDFVWIGAP